LPTSQPSGSPTSSPTFLSYGRGLVNECKNLQGTYNQNTSYFEAYFGVHLKFYNSTASQFFVPGYNESLIKSIQCLLNGPYSVLPVQVNITNMISSTVSKSKVTSTTSQWKSNAVTFDNLLEVRFNVKFLFPLTSGDFQPGLGDYYFQLTYQLWFRGFLQDKRYSQLPFIAIFSEYCGNCLPGLRAESGGIVYNTNPKFYGPYLLTAVPTIYPSVAVKSVTSGKVVQSIWSKLAVIIGTVGGILVVLFLLSVFYYFYLQRKEAREKEMELWQQKSDANIMIFKKKRVKEENMQVGSVNPGFKMIPKASKIARNVMDSMKATGTAIVRRLSYTGPLKEGSEVELAAHSSIIKENRINTGPLGAPRQQLHSSLGGPPLSEVRNEEIFAGEEQGQYDDDEEERSTFSARPL